MSENIFKNVPKLCYTLEIVLYLYIKNKKRENMFLTDTRGRFCCIICSNWDIMVER
jgi:hypothetical protein